LRRARGGLLPAVCLLAAVPAPAQDGRARVVFANNLPEVRFQDPEIGIYFVKVSVHGDGPADPNTGAPGEAPPVLKVITYGEPIEGKDLPGRVFDISRRDLERRKKSDPESLIRADRRRKIYEGALPSGAAWIRVRYDTAIYTRSLKEGPIVPGARNWLAFALPLAPRDQWARITRPAEPCPTLVVTITALVRGVHDDERDFTTSVEAACE
jgi:hypothetical protein